MEKLKLPRLDLDDIIRFWGKVLRKAPDECWNWTGGCTGNIESKRRPTFKIKFTNYIAARISYFIEYNEDPGELIVCHTCEPEYGKRQLCVNPNHLWIGTYSQNTQDMHNKGRHACDSACKLFDSQVREIRALRDQGLKLKEIGARFSMNETQIRKIALRLSYREVI